MLDVYNAGRKGFLMERDDQVFHRCKIREGEQHQRKMKIGVSIA